MRLSDREIECLLIHNTGYLAQRRLTRGLKLNYPEAIALISSQVLEFVRDGHTLKEVQAQARRLLGEKQVQNGVSKMINEIVLEGTFKDGLKLIKITNPICSEFGDFDLTFYGSYLPIPSKDLFEKNTSQPFEQIIEQFQSDPEIKVIEIDDAPSVPPPVTDANGTNGDKGLTKVESESRMDTSTKDELIQVIEDVYPGKIIIDYSTSEIEINKDHEIILLSVTNLGDEPISVGSHFNFIETNRNLKFDRAAAFGMRLNIPAGECVTFTPKETIEVPLIKIGGSRIVKGGNSIIDGVLNEETLKHAMKVIKKRGFSNEAETSEMKALKLQLPFKAKIPKEVYVRKYGPTKGDKIVLGDTNLIVHIEKDFTVYGDELAYGMGKVLREGMGQAVNVRNDTALDIIITNVVVVDSVSGIVKCDLGIRDGMIHGIGKGGNPHTMSNLTPGMVVGVGTEVINGEGLILTAGAIDSSACLISPQAVHDSLSAGITTVFGGGSGTSSSMSMSTSGPNNIKFMIQSTDEFPMNFGFYAKGNTSKTDGLAKELEDQLIAGAVGFRINENWGATPAAVDTCLRVADFHDVTAVIDIDSMHESYNSSELQNFFKNRVACVPINETLTNRSSLLEILKHINIIATSCTANNFEQSSQNTESQPSIEEFLHDIGAISMISSANQSCGSQQGRMVTRTWQIASKMKTKRGRLNEDKVNDDSSDNGRVKRYLAKYTINPAFFNGVSHAIGSVEPNKMADLVLWKPAFYGIKPEIVIKGGQIAWSQNGSSHLTCQPVKLRQQFGSYGKSPCANSVVFVSKACFEVGTTNTYGISKHVEPIKDCRNLTRYNMLWNASVPKITFNPDSNQYEGELHGRMLDVIDSNKIKTDNMPLTLRYSLF